MFLQYDERGKPDAARQQRVEEVPKSEGCLPERETEYIRWQIVVQTLPHCESRLTWDWWLYGEDVYKEDE